MTPPNLKKRPRASRSRTRAPRPSSAPAPLPQTRHAAMLAELDARKAPDIEYRAVFSTGSKTRLKKGETWRGRLQAWVEASGPFVQHRPLQLVVCPTRRRFGNAVHTNGRAELWQTIRRRFNTGSLMPRLLSNLAYRPRPFVRSA
jgi:hypothetical protein